MTEFIFEINDEVIVTWRGREYRGLIKDREIYDDEPDYFVRSDECEFDGCSWFREEHIKHASPKASTP